MHEDALVPVRQFEKPASEGDRDFDEPKPPPLLVELESERSGADLWLGDRRADLIGEP